jgi:hypothetical protein
MAKFAVFIIGLLCACSSPGVGFIGVTPVTVYQDRYEFDIYRSGSMVRGIKLSFGQPKSPVDFRQAFATAVNRAYACDVLDSTLSGDLVVLTAEVDCSNL